MKSEFVEVNGNKFHVVRDESGSYPVIFSHGFTDNYACMMPIMRELSDDFQCISYDAKAHGLSDAPTSGYAEREMAQDLIGIADTLGITEYGLYGHSMGAITSARVSERVDDAVQFMILEDPAGLLLQDSDRDKKRQEKKENLTNWRLKSHREIENSYERTPNFSHLLATARKQMRPEALKIDKRGYTYVGDILDDPPNTLLLRPDPSIENYADNDRDLSSNVEVYNIENTTHTIFRDNREKVLNIIDNFIESNSYLE